MTYQRPSRDENFLEQARIISKRATCLRRRYGAMIVKDNRILSTGYCGAASGLEDCLQRGYCIRQQQNIPSGTRYELCRSVHAEANAIINAAYSGTNISGAAIYICGEDSNSGNLVDAKPCSMCARQILNSKLEKVITTMADGSIKIYTLDDLRQIADKF